LSDALSLTHLTIDDNGLIIPNTDECALPAPETSSLAVVISRLEMTVSLWPLSSDWNVPWPDVVISGSCRLQSHFHWLWHCAQRCPRQNVVIKKNNPRLCFYVPPTVGKLVENIRISNCILEGRSYGGSWWKGSSGIVLMVTYSSR